MGGQIYEKMMISKQPLKKKKSCRSKKFKQPLLYFNCILNECFNSLNEYEISLEVM